MYVPYCERASITCIHVYTTTLYNTCKIIEYIIMHVLNSVGVNAEVHVSAQCQYSLVHRDCHY